MERMTYVTATDFEVVAVLIATKTAYICVDEIIGNPS